MVQLAEKSEVPRGIKKYIQWITTFGVFLMFAQAGIHFGWASPNVVKLTSPDSPIPLTPDETSWVMASTGIGGIFGSFLGSAIAEYLGSRKAILLTLVLFSVHWLLLIFADSFFWIITSRSIGGVAFSMVFGCFSLYLGEVTSANIRGTCVSTAASGSPVGLVVGLIAETYLPMHVSSSMYLASCVVDVALFLWLMDTPYCYVKKCDFSKAKKAIEFYYPTYDVDDTLKEIKIYIESNSRDSWTDKLKMVVSKPEVKKSMLLIAMLSALTLLCGSLGVRSYMETFLNSAEIDVVEPKQFVIYVNAVAIVVSILTVNLIDKLGRRILLITSSLGTTAAMVGLGLDYYIITEENRHAQLMQWLPLIFVTIYIVFFTIGYQSVPSAILGEIFSDDLKNVAALVSTLTISFSAMISLKSYQELVDNFGEACVFWIYGFFAFLATPICLFMLPETKGKSLQEIQYLLTRK